MSKSDRSSTSRDEAPKKLKKQGIETWSYCIDESVMYGSTPGLSAITASTSTFYIFELERGIIANRCDMTYNHWLLFHPDLPVILNNLANDGNGLMFLSLRTDDNTDEDFKVVSNDLASLLEVPCHFVSSSSKLSDSKERYNNELKAYAYLCNVLLCCNKGPGKLS